jgi:hypothetical protein
MLIKLEKRQGCKRPSLTCVWQLEIRRLTRLALSMKFRLRLLAWPHTLLSSLIHLVLRFLPPPPHVLIRRALSLVML